MTHDIAIDAVRVGPVSLHGDRSEPVVVDQPAGDAGPLPVELVGAVRRLADQHEAPVAHEIEERVVVVGRAGDRMSGPGQRGAPESTVDVPLMSQASSPTHTADRVGSHFPAVSLGRFASGIDTEVPLALYEQLRELIPSFDGQRSPLEDTPALLEEVRRLAGAIS